MMRQLPLVYHTRAAEIEQNHTFSNNVDRFFGDRSRYNESMLDAKRCCNNASPM